MICPSCVASLAVVAGSVTSGGGVVALVIARFRQFTSSRKLSQKTQIKEKQS